LLTEFIPKNGIEEIGIALSEVFEVPMALVDLEGKLLFLSESWDKPSEINRPEYVKYLFSMSRSGDKSCINLPGTGIIAIIPLKYNNIECAHGIIMLDSAHYDHDDLQINRVIDTVKKALGDISIYASWAASKHINQGRTEAHQLISLFQRGTVSYEQLIKNLLENVLSMSFAEVAIVALADEEKGIFEQAYIAGDVKLIPKCFPRCGLGWWSLHSKQSVIVNNPQNDPRCRREHSHTDIKMVAVWPLFMKDSVFGILFLARQSNNKLEQWLQDYIESTVVTISIILDNFDKEIKSLEAMRKMSALSEISRALNSSLDVNTVLNLMADMSLTLFNAASCCVYLMAGTSETYTLMAARGIKPEEVSVLGRRFENDNGSRRDNTGGFVDFPIIVREKKIGYISLSNFWGIGITDKDHELIRTFTHIAGIAIENSRMFEETNRTLMETITSLSLAVEARDKTMFGHSEMVRELAVALATALNIPPNDVMAVESASLLHDIGKLGISENILNKPGSLTSTEYESFKRHPVIGAEIISPITSFGLIRQIVKHHHERFDGEGYPDGLATTQIPLGSRILAMADTFASLVTKRSYRTAKEPFEALEIIRDNAGKQFDPSLIDAFEKVVRQRYSLRIDINQTSKGVSFSQQSLGANEMSLTAREGEILAYIAAGMNNKEIAKILFLSEKTVKTHVTHILKKLNLPDRTKAAIFAIQKGIFKAI
jgi:putative nucleotidyltransferase with HDIG domain